MRGSLVFAAALWATAASGAPSGELRVELNKLESVGEGCRVYLLFENGIEESLRSLKLDLVMFDQESVIARRLAVEGGPLAAGKTVLKVFDVPDLPCSALSRVLLNDVPACAAAEGERSDCLEVVETSSRTDAEFIK